jgi:hypothetical protein
MLRDLYAAIGINYQITVLVIKPSALYSPNNLLFTSKNTYNVHFIFLILGQQSTTCAQGFQSVPGHNGQPNQTEHLLYPATGTRFVCLCKKIFVSVPCEMYDLVNIIFYGTSKGVTIPDKRDRGQQACPKV